MTYNSRKRRSYKSMISSWTTFAFAVFFFYVLGDLIFNWWSGSWWIWLVIGLLGFGAISATLRYIAYGLGAKSSDYPRDNYEHDPQMYENENYQVSSNTVRIIETQAKKEVFCKYCGQEITGPASYCPNCGAMVE